MLMLAALTFLAVTSAILAAFIWFTPTKIEQRLEGIALEARPIDANWSETIVKLAGPLAKLSTPEGDWENSPLRIRFLNAGIRSANARQIYFGAKTIAPLALASATLFLARFASHAYGMTLLFDVLLAALLGCYLPNMVVAFKARARRREIFDNFPDASDLMLVCMEAGLGLDAALSKVADEVKRKSVALAEELHLTILEMRAGASRDKALHNLALRTGVEEIGTFASMLTQADKFGTSIGDSLRVFSDDLRYKRRIRAEEKAAKIPTKLLFPLVVCIFPAIIMVIMGPAAIQIIRTILPMLNGAQ